MVKETRKAMGLLHLQAVLIVLFWIATTTHSKPTAVNQVVYCINQDIPSPKKFNGELCLPLSYYAKHSAKFFDNQTNSNISLKFLSERSEFKLTSAKLVIKNVLQITLFSSTNKKSDVRIVLADDSGLSLKNISTVIFQAITVVGGTFEISDVDYFTMINTSSLISQLLVYNTRNIELVESTFESTLLNVSTEVVIEDKRLRIARQVIQKEYSVIATKCNFTLSSVSISLQKTAYVNLKKCFISNSTTGVVIQVQNSQLMANIESALMTNTSGLFIDIDPTSAEPSVINITGSIFAANLKGISMKSSGDTDKRSLFGSKLSMRNVRFIGNPGSFYQQLPIVLLNGIEAFVTDCQFENNTGTPIQVNFGNVLFAGNVTFYNNTGYRGGALSLIYSQMNLAQPSLITFTKNRATEYGGAIYIAKTPSPKTPPACFYQIPANSNASMTFLDNLAEEGGNEIYGAALNDTCIADLESKQESVFIYKSYFHFSPVMSLSRVSSDPKRVCLCNQGKPMCSSHDYIFHQVRGYPGEQFTFSVVAVGYEFGTVAGTVHANLLQRRNQKLPDFQQSQTVTSQSCNELQYTVNSSVNATVTLVLTVRHFDVGRYGDEGAIYSAISEYNQSSVIPETLLSTPVFINITMQACPQGFQYSDRQCKCHTAMEENGILACSICNGNRLFHRSGTQWIGKQDNSNSSAVLVTNRVPLGQCNPTLMWLDLDNEVTDNQCADNRTGRMCGQCKDGYSLTLGSSRCQECKNDYLGLLIAFAAAGPILVAFIKILDLTVKKATINGLIVYANLVWANEHIIFPTMSYDYTVFFKVFIAWINLDFGIDLCFYDGLNSVVKTCLQFVFPLYIWAIAGAIIVTSHYSSRVTRVFGNNSVPVLATLFLLSYAKLLNAIIMAFDFTVLHSTDGPDTLAWTEDPSKDIIEGRICMFVFSIICLLFFALPVTLALLFIQPLRSRSHHWPFKWVNKLMPFFEAYTGVLKDHHRYWVGLLLLARVIMLLISAVTPDKHDNLLTLAVLSAILCLQMEPYKNWYLSLLEKSFLINLTILASCSLYCEYSKHCQQVVVTSLLVGIAFLQFLCILCFHIFGEKAKNVYEKYKKRRARTGGDSDDQDYDSQNRTGSEKDHSSLIDDKDTIPTY